MMAERTRYLKTDPKGVEMMCKIMEDVWNDGASKQSLIIARNLIEQGQLSIEAIAQATELPIEKVIELTNGKTV